MKCITGYVYAISVDVQLSRKLAENLIEMQHLFTNIISIDMQILFLLYVLSG